MFKEQEEEKKRKYQQRVLDVEMSSFTPLVFGTNGGMGNECQRFLKHLADKIAHKDTEPYHILRESPAEDHAGKSTVHITDSPETWHTCTTSLAH